MRTWTGAAVVALSLTFCNLAAINSAMATPLQAAVQKPHASDATDLSARRRLQHHPRYAYRAYVQPHYYDRPDYYRPYPYVLPVPFFLGFNFGPW
jgi:hypothetical protein